MTNIPTKTEASDAGISSTTSRRDAALALLGALGGSALLKGCASGQSQDTNDDLAEGLDRANVGVKPLAAVSSSNIVRVGTIAELSTVSGSAEYIAIVGGYYAPGDGGGGVFVWSSTAKLHNGGTVINAGAVNPEAGWRRVYDSPVDVRWFGAKIEGGASFTTDAIQRAADASDHLYFPPGIYYVQISASGDNALKLWGKSQVAWHGPGAIIKMDNGVTASGQSKILFIFNCNHVTLSGLTFDGNRAARATPFATASHGIDIRGSHDVRLHDVTVLNSPCDGIYVRASTEADANTYPSDLLFDNVQVLNSYRSGLTLIGAKRVTLRGGRYATTNGTAPQCGMDIEPNATDVHSVSDVLIDGARFDANVGWGLMIGGSSVASKNVTVKDLAGSGNGIGLVEVGAAQGVVIDGVHVENEATSWTGDGLVRVSGGSADVLLTNLCFKNVSHPINTKSLVYRDNGGQGFVLDGFTAIDVTCNAMTIQYDSTLRNITLDNVVGELGIMTSGQAHSLSNVLIRNCSARVMYLAGASVSLNGLELLDCTGNAVWVAATTSVIRNVSAIRTTAYSGTYPLYYDLSAGLTVLENFFARAATTDYGPAQAIRLPTSTAGSRVRNVYPSPFSGSATFDPPSIAANASVSTTVALAKADVGDRAFVRHSIALGGLISHAQISSANTATVTFFNPTPSAINLASHTITVEVEK